MQSPTILFCLHPEPGAFVRAAAAPVASAAGRPSRRPCRDTTASSTDDSDDDASLFSPSRAVATARDVQRRQIEHMVVSSRDVDAVAEIASSSHPAVAALVPMVDATPLMNTGVAVCLPSSGVDSLAETVLASMLDAVASLNRHQPVRRVVRPDHIPLHSWSFHAHLLVQAGERRSSVNPSLKIVSPPCMYADQCVGMDKSHMAIPGFPSGFAGVPLMCVMTVKELSEHLHTGKCPPRDDLARPCLLCIWRVLTRLEINARAEDRFRLPDGLSLNHHSVTIAPGEYRSDVCVRPHPRNGLLLPVPALLMDRLFARRDTYGTWYVDHSAMRWPKTASAENTASFF